MSISLTINRWRGKKPLVFAKQPTSALHYRWPFTATTASNGVQAIRGHSLATGLRLRPRSREIKVVYTAPRWTCYFVYAPDGVLANSHRFTLARLREMGRPVLVVCATKNPGLIPSDLPGLCEALWWKELRGWDFSAYRVGLEAIAAKSARADVFVLNDSVYGPFANVESLLADAPWDLTGFTAFSLVENHIQSYAFQLKDVTELRLHQLSEVMPHHFVCDNYRSVIYLQETRFARIAAKQMSVGSLWYADHKICGDPTIYAGPDLLANGFPFMKKSLFGRNAGLYELAILEQLLEERKHTPPEHARTK